MKKLLQEFKEFAVKGDAMQLAVGVIIGGGFQAIVKSLTDDIISPLIGIVANKNFDELFVEILGARLTYGAFFTAVINFIIMAFVVFLLVKGLNRLTSLGKKEAPVEAPVPTTKACPFCKTEIDIAATRCPHCTSMLEG